MKRILAGILTICMIVLLLPVDAQGVGTVRTTGLRFSQWSPDGDIPADSITNLSEGWSWDKNSLTLTLSGIDLQIAGTDAIDAGDGIVLPDGATVVLQAGTVNRITFTSTANEWSVGLYGENMTVCGTGKLLISGGYRGIDAGNLTVKDCSIDIDRAMSDAIFADDCQFLDCQITTRNSGQNAMGICVFERCTFSTENMTVGIWAKQLTFVDCNLDIAATRKTGTDHIILFNGTGIVAVDVKAKITFTRCIGRIRSTNGAIWIESETDGPALCFDNTPVQADGDVRSISDTSVYRFFNVSTLTDTGVKAAFNRETGLVTGCTNEILLGMPFLDVPTDKWYYKYVAMAVQKGLVNGMSETVFAPESQTTRGMMVTLLYRLESTPSVDGFQHPFADVKSGRYFSNAVKWAYVNGLADGMSATSFVPDGVMTREQMATFLYRYAIYKGYDVSDSANLSRFVDYTEISPFARKALSWAVAVGLIDGMSPDYLAPKESASRAQVATLFVRFAENVYE
jgi:hypothetical protein